jgi:cobalt/nickel transport system permease protein
MHIPDGFLTPSVWGTMDLLSGSLVVVGLRQLGSRVEERAIPLMGVLSAFVFAAQMINLPVAGGTSAHFLGGALVGILAGPWSGLIIMTVVLVVQSLLFQDGGVAALGANIFDMAVIGSFGAFYAARALGSVLQGPRRLFWQGFLSSSITVAVSALSCATMLALSGSVSWKVGLLFIGGTNVFLGILEGLVTGTVLEATAKVRPDLLARAKV